MTEPVFAIPMKLTQGPDRALDDVEIDAWKDSMIECAKSIFDREGKLQAMTFFVCPNPETGSGTCFGIVPMNELMASQETKDIGADLMRRVLAQFKAVAYMFVSETWTKQGSSAPESAPDAKKFLEKQLDEDYEKYGPSLETHPGRGEAIMAWFETKKKSEFILYDILRQGGGKVLLQKSELPQGMDNGGRMVGWLSGPENEEEIQ